MNGNDINTRVNLDGLHSLDVTVNESKKTVIVNLVIPDEEPELIYAEKFDKPCDYLKTAIKRGIVYLNGDEKNYRSDLPLV